MPTNEEKELALRQALGYEPLEWQRQIRESNARFKVICMGRRGGKSYFVTYDTKEGLVSDLAKREQRVWIVAPNYDLTQRIWDELMILIQKEPFKQIIKRINNTKGWYRIETYLDTIIEAKSADEPEKLVGAKLTKLIIDEAALVRRKAWNQALRPTLIDLKGRALFISTPKGKNWFYDLYLKGQNSDEKEWKSWTFTTLDNPKLPREEFESLIKDMPDYEYRQEILAQFSETAEQVFRKIENCIEGKLEEPDPKILYSIGIDLGRKTSYSVISVINEKTFHLDYFDRFRWIDWSLIKERIRAVSEKYNHRQLRIDATGIGDPVIEDLKNMGLNVEPYIYTEVSKKQLIDKLSIYIQEKKITFPLIDILKWELERFGRQILETGKVRYRGMSGATDDCVNSLGLAVWDLAGSPSSSFEISPIKAEKVIFK